MSPIKGYNTDSILHLLTVQKSRGNRTCKEHANTLTYQNPYGKTPTEKDLRGFENYGMPKCLIFALM